MDVRTLSNDQLKDLKKKINRSNVRFFFWRYYTHIEIDGVSTEMIKTELKRRKTERLKYKRLNLGI